MTRVVGGEVPCWVEGVVGMAGDDEPADGFDGVAAEPDDTAPETLEVPNDDDPLDDAPGAEAVPVAVEFCD